MMNINIIYYQFYHISLYSVINILDISPHEFGHGQWEERKGLVNAIYRTKEEYPRVPLKLSVIRDLVVYAKY